MHLRCNIDRVELVTSVQNNVYHVKTSGVMAPMKRPDSRLYAKDLRSKNNQDWNLYALVGLIFDKDVVQLVSTLISIRF